QQPFLGSSEVGHVRAGVRPTQHCRQSNEQHFQQIVSRVVRARVRQPPENLLEPSHPTPSTIRESSSESFLPTNAIDLSNPYAIPLPFGGGMNGGNVSALKIGVVGGGLMGH